METYAQVCHNAGVVLALVDQKVDELSDGEMVASDFFDINYGQVWVCRTDLISALGFEGEPSRPPQNTEKVRKWIEMIIEKHDRNKERLAHL